MGDVKTNSPEKNRIRNTKFEEQTFFRFAKKIMWSEMTTEEWKKRKMEY